MCQFILLHALCHHHQPILKAGPYCPALKQQLMGIYDPSCYGIPGATPFQLNSATCEPNIHNTYNISLWCGWECRNTYDHTGALEKQFGGGDWSPAVGNQAYGLGEPGADFGGPRSGTLFFPKFLTPVVRCRTLVGESFAIVFHHFTEGKANFRSYGRCRLARSARSSLVRGWR